jgi:putative aminopeptidase FrvX
VIEGTTAADMPSQKGADKVLLARKRSGHPVYDNAQFYDRQMNARLSEIADRNGMKWQTKTAVAAEGRPAYRKADTGVK